MNASELKPIVEAMIFVAEEPITDIGLMLAFAEANIEKATIKECVALIEKEWNEDASRGLGLYEVAGGYQFRTKKEHADWLKKLNVPKPMRLSSPSLETLAIVAYKQPIVRSEIEKIRGVDTGGVLKTLLDRHLVRIVGRRDEPGQPLLYGTTKDFLEVFNLKTLTELPTLKDIEELMREHRTMTEAAAQEELSFDAAEPQEEELTETIDGEDEEATEVIKKKQVEEEEESSDEKDEEALKNLEQNLKNLRKLEHAMFPRPLAEEMGEVEAKEANDTESTQSFDEYNFAPKEEIGEVPDGEPFEADAPPADDSAGE